MHIACAHCGSTNRVPDERLAEDPVCGRCGQALLDGQPVELTDANFEAVAGRTELPVVVDFWAAWCGPCKMVAPEMEKLAAKYDGAVDVVKVDVDANPRLSQAFNILSIPTIAFFQPGSQPQGVVGFRPLEQLEQQFDLSRFATADVD